MADPAALEAEASEAVGAVVAVAEALAASVDLVALAEDAQVAVVQEEVFNDSPKST